MPTLAHLDSPSSAPAALNWQAQLVPLCWELVASKQQGPRIAAALLAGAAATALFKQQVTRQVLPLLAVLGSDSNAAVCRASIAASAVVFASFSGEADVQEALFCEWLYLRLGFALGLRPPSWL